MKVLEEKATKMHAVQKHEVAPMQFLMVEPSNQACQD